jgi:hypothetical protein
MFAGTEMAARWSWPVSPNRSYEGKARVNWYTTRASCFALMST